MSASFRFASRSALALAVALALAACGGGRSTGSAVIDMPPNLPAVETVNGVEVPQVLLEAVARGRSLDLSKPEQREKALRELTDYVLLSEEAQKQRLTGDNSVLAEMEISRLQGIANAAMRKFREQAAVDDAALKAEYDRQVAQAGKNDYGFSELLFTNEDLAIKAIGEVIGGKPFPQVYDAYKTQAKSARTVPRVRSGALPPAVAKALEELKIGDTTKVPVKVENGYTVLHLESSTPFTPPPFAQIKDNLRRTIMTKVADERLAKLRENAKVTMQIGASGKPKVAVTGKPAEPAPATSAAAAAPVATPAPATTAK